jgi:hypothetical protein
MTKRTKALSGASQDAYFRRVFKAYSGLSAEERDHLVHRLRREIAQLRLRRGDSGEVRSGQAEAVVVPTVVATSAVAMPVTAAKPFDPFALNIVLLVRKAGRSGALGALAAIDSVDDLRLLAREQRLSIGAEPGSAAEVRAAIVQAAERRIANRVAAAS